MINEFSINAKDFSIELRDIITKLDLIRDVVLVCGDEKIADFIGPDIRGVGLFLWDIAEDLETIYDTLYPEVDDATVKRLIKQYKGGLEEPEATASPETATLAAEKHNHQPPKPGTACPGLSIIMFRFGYYTKWNSFYPCSGECWQVTLFSGS